MSDVLHEILKDAARAVRANQRPLAVFDLDSTLFDLRPRITEIVLDFARDPGNSARYPAACARLLDFSLERRDWGLATPLGRLGLDEREHAEFFHELHAHWSRRFFSDSDLHRDDLVPGALEFVQELRRIGADILYLTARDVPRMWAGTVETLRARGFPLDDEHRMPGPGRARLILKPDESLDDPQFKAEVIAQERKTHDPIWFFENEAINLREAIALTPDVRLIFVDTNHSGRVEPWPELTSIAHFETDLAEFRSFFKAL